MKVRLIEDIKISCLLNNTLKTPEKWKIFKRLSIFTFIFCLQFIITTKLSINRSTRLKTLVIGIKILKESDGDKNEHETINAAVLERRKMSSIFMSGPAQGAFHKLLMVVNLCHCEA